MDSLPNENQGKTILQRITQGVLLRLKIILKCLLVISPIGGGFLQFYAVSVFFMWINDYLFRNYPTATADKFAAALSPTIMFCSACGFCFWLTLVRVFYWKFQRSRFGETIINGLFWIVVCVYLAYSAIQSFGGFTNAQLKDRLVNSAITVEAEFQTELIDLDLSKVPPLKNGHVFDWDSLTLTLKDSRWEKKAVWEEEDLISGEEIEDLATAQKKFREDSDYNPCPQVWYLGKRFDFRFAELPPEERDPCSYDQFTWKNWKEPGEAYFVCLVDKEVTTYRDFLEFVWEARLEDFDRYRSTVGWLAVNQAFLFKDLSFGGVEKVCRVQLPAGNWVFIRFAFDVGENKTRRPGRESGFLIELYDEHEALAGFFIVRCPKTEREEIMLEVCRGFAVKP